jgi:hypothetical protein
MPISWTLDDRKRLVYVTLTQPYTRDQARAAATAITTHPEFARGFGFVVELIGGGEPTFVTDVMYFLATHKETFRHARVAIVVTMRSGAEGKPAIAEMLAKHADLPMIGPGIPDVPRSGAMARARRLIEESTTASLWHPGAFGRAGIRSTAAASFAELR